MHFSWNTMRICFVLIFFFSFFCFVFMILHIYGFLNGLSLFFFFFVWFSLNHVVYGSYDEFQVTGELKKRIRSKGETIKKEKDEVHFCTKCKLQIINRSILWNLNCFFNKEKQKKKNQEDKFQVTHLNSCYLIFIFKNEDIDSILICFHWYW